MNTPTAIPPSSLPGLLRELRDGTTQLFRQEVALARTEVKENISHLAGDIVRLAIGGVVALVGAIVLLIGLSQAIGILLVRAGVSAELASWLAPSGLGLLVAIVGWSMISRARHAMSNDHLIPHETIDSLKTTKHWVQQKLPQS